MHWKHCKDGNAICCKQHLKGSIDMRVTMKEYAESRGISYEAVRSQVKRYEKELEKHLTKSGRYVELDEEACKFLDQHRQPRAVVLDMISEDAKTEIESLRAQIEEKDKLIEQLKTQIVALQGKYIGVLEEKTQLLPYKANAEVLEADKKRAEEKYQEAEKRAEELTQRLTEAEAEASSYQKSFFGFYRKK